MMETKSVTICGHCGMEQPMHSQFCFKCGTKIGKMTCGACGATLPNGCQYCMGCGARLGENGNQIFKVTFDWEANVIFHQVPCRIVIDKKRRETIKYGHALEIYLPEGKHELEVRFGGKSQCLNQVAVEKDMFIKIKRLLMLGLDVIIQ